MKIGEQEIGPGHRPYVIAEIGVNHDGEVSRALELTDAAEEAGADAVKLQLFETDRLMSKAAKLAAYQKNAGETDPLAMLRRLELSIDEMAKVVDRAHELGIHAIVTVFSVELVEVAEQLPWDAYKSASPDIINKPLLEAMAATGKPLIVSTGASELEEVTRAADWLDGIRDRLALLQCVSCYPAPEPALWGIRAIQKATRRTAGYSDHAEHLTSGAQAVACGACLLEKHLTHDNEADGPDHAASLIPIDFQIYTKFAHWVSLQGKVPTKKPEVLEELGVRLYETFWQEMYGPDYDKEANQAHHRWLSGSMWAVCLKDKSGTEQTDKYVLDCERDVREVSRQSLVTTKALSTGHTISRDDLTIKRPGTGLPPYMFNELIGRTLSREVEMDVPLVEEDLA